MLFKEATSSAGAEMSDSQHKGGPIKAGPNETIFYDSLLSKTLTF